MMQLSFLEAPLPAPSSGPARRDAALTRQEAVNRQWLVAMRAEAVRLARDPWPAAGITADDLRDFADRLRRERGLVPRSPNAAGAIFRGPQWEHVGWIKSRKPGHHATDLRVWRLRP